ncbi:MAG: sulfatase [Bacteroidota bacterium]
MKGILLLLLVLQSLCVHGNDTPNFVIIMADDCTFRDLEVYGGQAKTPNLIKFASEGMKFNRCFQSTAMCAPTRQSLLTGIYPVRLGAYANHSKTNEGIKSIVHHLTPLNYLTALTGKRHIGPESVYPFMYSQNTSDPDLDFIKGVLKKSKNINQPFCIFAMCSSPHAPWTKGDVSQYPLNDIQLAPYLIDTKETREAYSKYLAEITYFDQQVGEIVQLIEEFNLEENTIVIVLSEQGSLFPFEKWTCYDAGLQSALLVRFPKVVSEGVETHAMVEYVDIVPTLLDFAGIKPISKMDGKSFKEVLLTSKQKHKNHVFGVQTTRGINAAKQAYGIRSVRNDSLKYIVNLFPENHFENTLLMDPEKWSSLRKSYLWWMQSWRKEATKNYKAYMLLKRYQHRSAIELYHVKNDPYELTNLALNPNYKKDMEELAKELELWMIAQGDEGRDTELKIPIR